MTSRIRADLHEGTAAQEIRHNEYQVDAVQSMQAACQNMDSVLQVFKGGAPDTASWS